MTIQEFIDSLPEEKKVSPQRVSQLIKNLVINKDYKMSRSSNNRFAYDILPTGVEKLLKERLSGRPRTKPEAT